MKVRDFHIDRIQAALDRAAHKAVHGTRVERSGRFNTTCEGCGINEADPPSLLCPGCQAYSDHQR